MPINVSWYDEPKRILHIELVDQWNWDDFQQAVQESHCLASSVPERVDLIADLVASGPLPKGTIQRVRQALFHYPANWGVTVVVQNSMFVEMILNTFTRIYPQFAPRFPIAHSMHEAQTVIEQDRKAVRVLV